MSVPLDHEKWQRPSHLNPAAYIDYLTKYGLSPQLESPRGIFCWASSLASHWAEQLGAKKSSTVGKLSYKLPKANVFNDIGIGAPAAGMSLELLVEAGLKEVVGIGVAGALNPALKPGDIVICNSAMRDEGTSYHYLSSEEKSVEADEGLLKVVEGILSKEDIKFRSGPTWTTDAPYRETKKEIDMYGKQGVLTVDMEASALYAISKVRGIQAVSVFIISDLVCNDLWEPQFRNKQVKQSYLKVLTAIAKQWGGHSG